MTRLRLLAGFIAAVLIAALTPAATAAATQPSWRTSEVDFGHCTELSTGTVVSLAELQERVPQSVPVLSMTEQGFVFPGSDELGILIVRTLKCDSISVTANGRTKSQYDRHIAHIGTPVDPSVLPPSPFSNDGDNGADFNNYIFAYYSDSQIYRSAMHRAGVRPVVAARISMHDTPAGECQVDRVVSVSPRSRTNNYGLTASGIIPDASCEPPVVPFIANWWSVKRGNVAVLSNNIPGQSAIFIDPAETVITLEAGPRSEIGELFGSGTATADAFAVLGAIPETEGTDMVITRAGRVGR